MKASYIAIILCSTFLSGSSLEARNDAHELALEMAAKKRLVEIDLATQSLDDMPAGESREAKAQELRAGRSAAHEELERIKGARQKKAVKAAAEAARQPAAPAKSGDDGFLSALQAQTMDAKPADPEATGRLFDAAATTVKGFAPSPAKIAMYEGLMAAYTGEDVLHRLIRGHGEHLPMEVVQRSKGESKARVKVLYQAAKTASDENWGKVSDAFLAAVENEMRIATRLGSMESAIKEEAAQKKAAR